MSTYGVWIETLVKVEADTQEEAAAIALDAINTADVDIEDSEIFWISERKETLPA